MRKYRWSAFFCLGLVLFVNAAMAGINIKIVNDSKDEKQLKEIDSIIALIDYSKTEDPYHSTKQKLSKENFPRLGQSKSIPFNFVKLSDKSLKIIRIDFSIQFERQFQYCQMRKIIEPKAPYQDSYEFKLSDFSPEKCLNKGKPEPKTLHSQSKGLEMELPR